MNGFVLGCIMSFTIVSALFIAKGSVIINPKDVKESVEVCKYRGGLADITAWIGEDIYYYCKDGYQVLPAPAYRNPYRADFEQYVKREGFDMHLGFTNGKYSNESTQKAFMLFCAGAEAK